jgi:hypothetical protein
LEETEHDQLSDLVEIVYYELPKLEKKLKAWLNGEQGYEGLTKEERWWRKLRFHILSGQAECGYEAAH